MTWPGPLLTATFLKRYKRFLADFRLADGQLVTAHCANTGSMKTCMHPEAEAWLSFHDNPKRKLKYSWQAIRMPDGWVGINTGLANGLVVDGIKNGVISELAGYHHHQRERKYGNGSRIDILLSDGPDERPCYVEVKNVTLELEPGIAGFPDAVTTRGTKHLNELMDVIREGHRAVLVYCVQRESIREVHPAQVFDPVYARTLAEAAAAGLEVIAYRAEFSMETVRLVASLPVILGESRSLGL